MATNQGICVAIPAYNEEKSIARTLAAVSRSRLRGYKLKIFVCLSACTDGALKEITQFKKDHRGVHIEVVTSKIKGKVRAIKKLDRHINSKIGVFVDADSVPQKNSIYRVYRGLLKAQKEVLVVSGNTVDPRYMDKNTRPKTFIESFNRAFWQRTGRKIINGPLYAIRKGIIQKIPDDIISEDTFLSVICWNRFINDANAVIYQGSGQSVYDKVRYQKNFQAAYNQIRKCLEPTLPNVSQILAEISGQFKIRLSDKRRYYPNISYVDLIAIKLLLSAGELWGKLSKPTWDQTVSSKEIAA